MAYNSKEDNLEKELDILEESLIYDTECIDIEKGKTSQVTKDSHGNLIYRGIKFAGYSKPRKSDNPKKDRMVLVRKGDEVKIVRYGDASMKQNYSKEANDRFYDRFGGRPEAKDKFSATYWSLRDLWPRGALKGKGAKPLTPLKKSQDIEGENLDNELEDFVPVVPDTKDNAIPITKRLDEEEMIAIEPLYITVGESDAHGDGITDTELNKMIDNFNKNIDNIKGNIHHQVMVEDFKPIKAYRLPLSVYVGDPDDPESLSLIEKGQPVVEVQFYEKEAWEKRKSGFLKGVSIGAQGRRIPNPDYEGDD